MFLGLSQVQSGSLRCFKLGERHGDPGLLCQLGGGRRCIISVFSGVESLLCALPGIELSPYPWHNAGLGGDFFLFSWHLLRGQVHPCSLESPTTVGEEGRMCAEAAGAEGSHQ